MMIFVSLFAAFAFTLAWALSRPVKQPPPLPLKEMGELVDATIASSRAAAERAAEHAAETEAMLREHAATPCSLCGKPHGNSAADGYFLGAHYCVPPKAVLFIVTAVPFDVPTEPPPRHRSDYDRPGGWVLVNSRVAEHGVELVWRCEIMTVPEARRIASDKEKKL